MNIETQTTPAYDRVVFLNTRELAIKRRLVAGLATAFRVSSIWAAAPGGCSISFGTRKLKRSASMRIGTNPPFDPGSFERIVELGLAEAPGPHCSKERS